MYTGALYIYLQSNNKSTIESSTLQENVLAHIGATYYIEINFDDTNHTFAHDSIPRHVLQETRYPLQAPLSNVAYLRKCVQKIFNDAYGEKLSILYPFENM